MGKDPDARLQYAEEPWYEFARVFTDEWDQTSFDPEYDTLPLSHFEPKRLAPKKSAPMNPALESFFWFSCAYSFEMIEITR